MKSRGMNMSMTDINTMRTLDVPPPASRASGMLTVCSSFRSSEQIMRKRQDLGYRGILGPEQ